MDKKISEYFARLGSKGGKTSRRTLTKKQARAMVEAREKNRRRRKRIDSRP
jgi:hypothetical protein